MSADLNAARSAKARAHALIGLKRYADAADAARSGLVADPHDADLYILVALGSCESGRPDDAVEAGRRAVALAPSHAAAHRALGLALGKAKQHGAAAGALAEAINLDPWHAHSHVVRAETLLHMSGGVLRRAKHRRELFAEADRHAAEAVRLDPNDAGGYFVHAKVALARKDGGIADKWALRGLAREPDHHVGHQLRGLAAEMRNEPGSAADHFVAAGKLDPRSRTSTSLLRGVRASLPIGVLAAYIIVRVLVVSGRAIGGVVAVAAGVLAIAFLAWYLLAPRWQARRVMSPAARQALDRDRRLRGRTLRGRLRRRTRSR